VSENPRRVAILGDQEACGLAPDPDRITISVHRRVWGVPGRFGAKQIRPGDAGRFGFCRETGIAKDRICGLAGNRDHARTATRLGLYDLPGPQDLPGLYAIGITAASGPGGVRRTGNCAILASDESL
jgi:hypothetical protein